MIKAFSHSEVGGHLVNEDAFEVRQHRLEPNCWICTLADGQGGRSGGGWASRLACETMMRLAEQQTPGRLMDYRVWAGIFRECDKVVSADSEAGFTTLIGLCLEGGKICGGSSGDSAVATFDERGFFELTRNQQKNPPIGSGSAAFVPFAANLTEPWLVAVMSDGVWKYTGWDRVREMGMQLRGSELIDSLLRPARLTRTGQLQDDFTIVLLESNERQSKG